MKNLNWGFGIVSVFVLFVLFIVGLVLKTHSYNVDLVSEDYYDKEIHFQDHIDKTENGRLFADSIQLKICPEQLEIKINGLPKGTQGEISFFNPSDPKRDFTLSLDLDARHFQYIDLKKFRNGYYKAQLNWDIGGKKYFVEKILIIK